MKFVLASLSPRRRELIFKVCKNCEMDSAEIEENIKFSSPTQLVKKLSLLKASEVAKMHPQSVVIGADTVVVLGGKVLNKPNTFSEAFAMLSALSGKTHSVLTGVSVIYLDKQVTFVEKSIVKFFSLTETDITNYINSGSPFDKAGGYGIQECEFAQSIDGSLNNVIGLPTERLLTELKQFLLDCNISAAKIENSLHT